MYATTGYEASVQNLSKVSLDSDNVFSDGYDLQIPTITGNVDRRLQPHLHLCGVTARLSSIPTDRVA